MQSIGGMAWETQGSKLMAQMEPPTLSVEAHPGYSVAGKMYVISNEKMEREGLKQPAAEKEMEEFFKKHADSVLIIDEDIPVEKVDVANATEKK